MLRQKLNIGLFVLILSIFLIGTSVSADGGLENNYEELYKLQPGITMEEVKETVKVYAEDTGLTELEATELILKELNEQIEADRKESAEYSLQGGSSGNKKLPLATKKGDIFYTPSSTLGIPHGHNGIYYARDSIVESIPSTGVRQINYRDRNVEAGAVVQEVRTTAENRSNAADWAQSRVGDSYSYNFATNRKTGHYGAKNCSKLLWSAFKLKADIDIDANGGAGVYPKDIRDSSYTTTYIEID